MAKTTAEAGGHAAVQRVLADVPERRMAEVVAEPDRLDEILVESQRAGHRPRDLRDLERVCEPGAVVVAGRRDEHLSLVLEASKRLGVHDAVAVALKRRAQAAVGLGMCAVRGVGRGGQRRQRVALELLDARGERVGDRPRGVRVAGLDRHIGHPSILTPRRNGPRGTNR